MMRRNEGGKIGAVRMTAPILCFWLASGKHTPCYIILGRYSQRHHMGDHACFAGIGRSKANLSNFLSIFKSRVIKCAPQ